MRRFFIFGIGSTVGALIDFTLSLLLLKLGLSGWLALALSMLVSANVVYAIHQKVTFADLDSADLHAGRLTAFVLNTALVYLFRLALFELLRLLGLAVAVALCIALVASVGLNFAVSRILIFSGRKAE